MFIRNKLSAAIVTVVASVAAQNPAFAQEDSGIVEEVLVTGIRASLEASMDVKRDSVGVVDAISAEDMGKFPDTNLAESLQRITGVSIDRRNGEGATVTIRGFGADQNLVTLNGRQMPTASAFGGGSGAGGTRGGNTRSFDFANLASESVSGVQVYKTGKASISSGGIGGTVNILTGRPLDKAGFNASVGAKAVMDDTVRVGDDVTPEVSGIFSWTDDSETFGVSLSGVYQERHSGAANAAMNDWNLARWGQGNNLYSLAPGLTEADVFENAPEPGQLYARPNDLRYAFTDNERERVNSQLTLQFRPTDSVTLTGDFTYAENHIKSARGEQTFWFANDRSANKVIFDDSAIATPTYYSEVLNTKDMGFEQQYRDQTDTLESLGFNVEWDVNDSLVLRFDVHNSTMESVPTGPGRAGSVDISIAAPIASSQEMWFGGDLPEANMTINDGVQAQNGEGALLYRDANGDSTTVDTGNPIYRGNNNGQFDVGDFGTQVARVWYAEQVSEVNQAKFDGSWEFDEGRFDFGLEYRNVETDQKNSDRYMGLGDWGVATPGEIPANLLEEFALTDQYDDHGLGRATRLGVRGDAVALTEWALGAGGYDGELAMNPVLSTYNIIEEEILAGYVQFGFGGQIAGMEANVLAGVRYETTDVTSTSYINTPQHLLWQDNNDFTIIRSEEVQPFSFNPSYDHFLPSVDFDLHISDELIARMSYGTTIARAGYGSMGAARGGFGTIGSTLLGATPTANKGSPGLLPLESDNIDLSLEWYYDDTSYASIGLFEKRVTNFLGNEQVLEPAYGMLDVTNGELVNAAYDALIETGLAPADISDTNLFVMSAILANPTAYPTGAAAYNPDPQFAVGIATEYDLAPEAGRDPLMQFRTSTPINNASAKLYGAEFAVQHFFGDTGFGIQANYTMVRGENASFNDEGDPGESQFALAGLSDTANLVAIYEDYGVSARLAWNWRDSFLNETNRGNSLNPVYVEAFSSIDMNVGYEFNDQLSVFLEAINVTGEDVRHYGRNETQLWYMEDLGPRYQVGARFTF